MTADGAGLGEQVYQRIDDLERQMDESTARIARAKAMTDVLRDIVGSAETDDGHIRVEFAARGVSDIVLNPRAMKRTADDFADALKKTIADAANDYRERTVVALREAGVLLTPEQQRAESEKALAQFGEARTNFSRSLRAAADAIGSAARTDTHR